MKRTIIDKFRTGKWSQKAKQYMEHHDKIKELLKALSKITHKKGLKNVHEQLQFMYEYAYDICNGNYTNYNLTSLIIIIAAIIYVVTPIDIFPDILPVVGWIDDVTVILYVCDIINDELEQYKQFIIINKRGQSKHGV